MMQHSKFFTNPGPHAGTTHKSSSQGENLAPHSVLSPELFWTFFALINQNVAIDIAWRKAVYDDKEHVNTTAKDDGIQNTYYKSKLTGSPVFKELKT